MNRPVEGLTPITPEGSTPELHRINETNATPADVWQGHGDGTGEGALTPFGRQLQKSNPALADVLARQSQHDHTVHFPHLYPQTPGERPPDRPELRRRPAQPVTEKQKAIRLSDEDLPHYFGRSSDGGKANDLAKRNAALYAGSKERAIELGLLSPARSTKR